MGSTLKVFISTPCLACDNQLEILSRCEPKKLKNLQLISVSSFTETKKAFGQYQTLLPYIWVDTRRYFHTQLKGTPSYQQENRIQLGSITCGQLSPTDEN